MGPKPSHLDKGCVRQLEEAAHIAANVVSQYGDKYWPIFDRIETELVARRSREERLSKFRIKA